MIAAAMMTRNSTQQTYIELARAGAKILRQLDAQQCVRLGCAVKNLTPVDVELCFTMTQQGRVGVVGKARTQVEMDCHRCLESVNLMLDVDFDAVLAFDEKQAALWAKNATGQNVVVVASPVLNELELIEDELLLQLPQKTCLDENCQYRPKSSYGDGNIRNGSSGESNKASEVHTQLKEDDNPFAVLGVMKLKD